MKILLLQPAKSPASIGGEDIFLYEPLALEYVAAGVRDDHDVRILDLRLEPDLEKNLDEFCPDIVGVTAYTVHVNVARALMKQVKEWNRKVVTVVGGHHATVKPDDFVSPSIDVIVMGDGVSAFREIVRRSERGETLDTIPGVALVKDNKLMISDPSPAIELDELPFPDRRLTSQYRHKYYSEWMKPLASIRTSKGCPFRCTFCALWKLTGGRYLRRQPEKVLEELGEIHEGNIFFADDESLVDVKRMSALARLIRDARLGKRFFLYGRSDTIAKNPGLIELWCQAGLERVFVGLEFLSDDNLAYINKASTEKDNREAVRILTDLGLDTYASFIIRPEFTRDDFAALGSYCGELGLSYASFSVLTPLPGTDLYEETKDRLITRNYDYFDFIHTLLATELPLKEFYERFAWLYDGAIPLRKRLGLLSKFPLRDIPSTVSKSRAVFNRMRTAYRDYE
ncbi:MAG: cobalamin-dependent protein [Candidatus Zixiibacteriota bacterium]|nr:MAG: cobalamin-dependent protein [candidate division Zixibacteria bacterium]